MKTLNVLIPLALFTIALVLACDQRAEPERAAATAAQSPATPNDEEDHDHDHEEGAAPANDTPLIGQQTVGEPMLDSVELVNAADIIANPDQFAGRTVKISGQVKGYCHHRRAWFALDVPTATPPYIRVLTAPAFLVPEGAINALATTVGVVEVQEVTGSRVHHYEQEHQLGSGNHDGVGRAKRVVIRATGAEFVAE